MKASDRGRNVKRWHKQLKQWTLPCSSSANVQNKPWSRIPRSSKLHANSYRHNGKFEVWTRSEQSTNSHGHTRHDTDRTVLSCLAGDVNWALQAKLNHRTARAPVTSVVKCRLQRRDTSDHIIEVTLVLMFWWNSRCALGKIRNDQFTPPDATQPRDGLFMSRRVGWRKLRVTKRSSGGYEKYEVDPDRADYDWLGLMIRFALRNFITSAMSLLWDEKTKSASGNMKYIIII